MSPYEPIQSVSPSPIRYAKPHGLWSQICGFPCSTMVSAAPLGRHPAGELMRHLGYTECICLLILLNRSVRPPVYSCQFSPSNIFFFDIFWMPVWMMECLGTRHDRDDLPWSKKLHPPLSPIIGHWKSWRTCAFNTCWTHATPIRERERANENDMYCYWPYSSGPIPVISQ